MGMLKKAWAWLTKPKCETCGLRIYTKDYLPTKNAWGGVEHIECRMQRLGIFDVREKIERLEKMMEQMLRGDEE